MARREELTDEQWEIIAPLITEPPRREDGRGGSVIKSTLSQLDYAPTSPVPAWTIATTVRDLPLTAAVGEALHPDLKSAQESLILPQKRLTADLHNNIFIAVSA